MSELDGLRDEITELDRRLLELLNRRLELVASVRDVKDAAGERWIDPEREAELLQALVAANPGPLSERGVLSIFSAVLDVLKQEVAAERRAPSPPDAAGERPRWVERLAVVGTGLIGSSVALAAGRAGTSCRGFDPDSAVLERAAGRGALEPAASIADARFVPSHPVAGGTTGGPARAAADLFDAAIWFLTPTEASSAESVTLVERFVASLGAHAVRTDAEAHDRLLALTSHLPHALANLLMLRVAEAAADDDAPLAFAGASLREMTRLAGANAAVWSDIFLGNADEIASALDGLRDSLDELEQSLREGDRDRIEATIATAAAARERLESFAYRTAPAELNRIRLRIPDQPGVLARITQILGAAQINLEDFELRHVSPEYGGVLVILVAGADNAERARELLRREGYSAA